MPKRPFALTLRRLEVAAHKAYAAFRGVIFDPLGMK